MGSALQLKPLKCIRFSLDKSSTFCYNEDGLQVYDTSSSLLTPKFKLNYDEHEIKEICGTKEVLIWESVHNEPDQLVIVTGINPERLQYLQNVTIYDGSTKRKIIPWIRVHETILSVRCMKNKLILVFPHWTRIYCYNPTTKELLTTYNYFTSWNRKGLCEIALGEQITMVCWGQQKSPKGSIEVVTFDSSMDNGSGISQGLPLQAHEGELACIALNQIGSLLATASEKGTLVRVWDTKTRRQLHELRRGANPARICSLAFDSSSSLLCCISDDRETGHIFSLKDSDKNTRSLFAGTSSGLGEYVPNFLGNYINSQWAVTKFTRSSKAEGVCAFDQSGEFVIVICKDGSFENFKLNLESISSPSCEFKPNQFVVDPTVEDESNNIHEENEPFFTFL